MPRLIIALAVALTSLALTGTAGAAAPAQTTSVLSLSFVDDESCAFAVATTVERVRTVVNFENGDQQRRIHLTVSSSANGKTWVERDAYIVFVDAASPDAWTIVGDFTRARLIGGGTILLQSGRIAYDVQSDTITDLHPGPHDSVSDPAAAMCTALAA